MESKDFKFAVSSQEDNNAKKRNYLSKRIIPCLDVKNGRTVKGVNFENLKDAGDPVELAAQYAQHGADELVFLDISATLENRGTQIEMVKSIARVLNIPFTIGGGIRSVEDAGLLLEAGADKISINSAAINDPKLIEDLAQQFGVQFVVLAVDSKFTQGTHQVFKSGGTIATGLETISWIKQAYELGAGEILLTSMDRDGTKAGFDKELLLEVGKAVPLPLIASGGAGKMEDFRDAFLEAHVDATLAASVFHYGEISIPALKAYLNQEGVSVRL